MMSQAEHFSVFGTRNGQDLLTRIATTKSVLSCVQMRSRLGIRKPLRWPSIVGVVATSGSCRTKAEESFAAKVTRAVNTALARRPDTCKAARERAEAERERYLGGGGLQRRARVKGE